MSVISELAVNLIANTASFSKGMQVAENKVESFAKKATSIQGAMAGIGSAFAAVGVSLGATFAVKSMIDRAAAAESAHVKLAAVVRASGEASGLSARQMEDYASKLQATTGYSKGATIAAETVMSAFHNIKGDVFRGSIKAAQDMSTVMGTDLHASAIKVGKALQDPVNGLTALRKVGVMFTHQQKEHIAAMVKMGDAAGAQKFILKELNSEFGGAAAAAMKTYDGQVKALSASIGSVAKTCGEVLLPVAQLIVGAFKGIADSVKMIVDGVKEQGSKLHDAVFGKTESFDAAQSMRDIEKSIRGASEAMDDLQDKASKTLTSMKEHSAAIGKSGPQQEAQRLREAAADAESPSWQSNLDKLEKMKAALQQTKAQLERGGLSATRQENLEDDKTRFQESIEALSKATAGGQSGGDLAKRLRSQADELTKASTFARQKEEQLGFTKQANALANDVKQLGMSDMDKHIEKMRLSGMGQEARDKYRDDFEAKQGYEQNQASMKKHAEEMHAQAERFTEAGMSPADKIKKEMQQVQESFSQGLIGPGTMQAMQSKLSQDMAHATEPKTVGALEWGTAAAFSQAMKNDRDGNAPQVDLGKQQVDLQQKMVRSLDDIAKDVKSEVVTIL